MTHEFTDHCGRTRTLFKHKREMRAFREGKLTTAELATKPWYFRHQSGEVDKIQSLGTSDPKEAVRLAKGLVQEASGDANKLTGLMEATATRGTVTCGTIARDWLAKGCPDDRNRPRAGEALSDRTRHIHNALAFFGPRPVASLTPRVQQDYVAHVGARVAARRKKQQTTMQYTGLRTAKVELEALRLCFDWAVIRELIPTNPLTKAAVVYTESDITHNRFMQPANGDELHNLARWLIEAGRHTDAARVLFGALTGLRRNELLDLRWHHAGMTEGTPGFRTLGDPVNLGYGPAAAKVEYLHVARLKKGIHQAVVVHPALASFLTAWRAYRETKSTTGNVDGQLMFPTVCDSEARHISGSLNDAARALGSPKNRFGEARRTIHGLRAFYVSVRRSMGAPDVIIALELGHGTGPEMVKTYGDRAIRPGDSQTSWLPAGGKPPAWELFLPAAAATIPFTPAIAA
jgi:integrase